MKLKLNKDAIMFVTKSGTLLAQEIKQIMYFHLQEQFSRRHVLHFSVLTVEFS